MLTNLGAAQWEGKKLFLTNAAVLFFAKRPKLFHIQSRISCLLFQGTTKTTILDRKDFEGPLLESVRGALAFLGQHIPLRYEIKGLKRKEIPLLPEAATREALLNAAIHRDYFERGGAVFIEVYRDRVEILNPGGLVPGLKIQNLGRLSLPRDPLLADLFHRLGFVEKAGTGIGRIRTSMTEAGLNPPVFDSDSFFTVRFKMPSQQTSETKQLSASIGTKSTLSRHQVKVLIFCMTPRALVEIITTFGRTDRTKFRDSILNPLLSAGDLEMTVKDRPKSRLQKYITTEKGKQAIAKS